MSEQETLDFVAQRRKALNEQQAAARAKVDEARNELAALEREDKALAALERALRPDGSGGARNVPGEIRKAILAAIHGKPDGLTPAEIIDTLGARGNKTRQDAIRNALHVMKKPRGQHAPEVRHANGRYLPPVASGTEPTSAKEPSAPA